MLQSASSGEIQNQTAFKTFLEAGRWYMFFYNDDGKPQTVSFVATENGETVMIHCRNIAPISAIATQS